MEYNPVTSSPPGMQLYVATLRYERMLRSPEFKALADEIAQDRILMENELSRVQQQTHTPMDAQRVRHERSIDTLAA